MASGTNYLLGQLLLLPLLATNGTSLIGSKSESLDYDYYYCSIDCLAH